MAGQDSLEQVARIQDCEAHTYRAYEIESYDTVFLSSTLGNGAALKLAVSHTLREDSNAEAQSDLERYDFERATLEFPTWRTARIVWKDGSRPTEHQESGWRDYRDVVRENFLSYANFLLEKTPRPITTLQDSESFVKLCHESQHASEGIGAFSSERLQIGARGGRAVLGLENQMRNYSL
jgi:hypothetical protein